jgi:hypothetical protein
MASTLPYSFQSDLIILFNEKYLYLSAETISLITKEHIKE